MDSFSNNISGLMFCDSKTSLLSLQLLDEVAVTQPIQQSIVNKCSNISQLQSFNQLHRQLIAQQNYRTEPQKQLRNIQNNLQFKKIQSIDYQLQPTILFETDSQHCAQSQIQNGFFANEQSNSYINKPLNHSQLGEISKRQSYEFHEQSSDAFQNQIHTLRDFQQKARAQLQQSDNSQQIKQNFEVLFQKVYGIIQQIQLRNQKSQLGRSMVKNNIRPIKKQLSLTTRVIQLSVGKQNDRLRKKKFCNLQTQFDYNNDHFDEGTINKQHIYTQQNNCPSTPFVHSSRTKPNLLTLSKQYPSIVSPKAQLPASLCSARSDRSIKSKGLSLVSADKKIQRLDLQPEAEVKKPVKITLMQKKIVQCPKKNIQLSTQPKADKKIASFSANNFFSARRITAARVI